MRTAWRFQPFQLTKLIVVDAERGSRVTITCKGGGCPFARERIKVKRSRKERSVLGGRLRRADLARGTVVEVRITKPRRIGFLRRHTVRGAQQDPKIVERCLPPGKRKSVRC